MCHHNHGWQSDFPYFPPLLHVMLAVLYSEVFFAKIHNVQSAAIWLKIHENAQYSEIKPAPPSPLNSWWWCDALPGINA